VFNPQAGRPYPSLRSPLAEYEVTLERVTALSTTSMSVPTFASAYCALNQFSYTDLAAVFDQYRVKEVEVWIEPSIIMSSTVGSAVFFTAVDLDDANVPTSSNELVNHASVISSETGTGHYHRWVPYMATAVYSGAFTSFASGPPQWIDVASPGVQHYGLKYVCPGADGVARLINITMRATFQFRGAEI
jgi:hypothetical protein